MEELVEPDTHHAFLLFSFSFSFRFTAFFSFFSSASSPPSSATAMPGFFAPLSRASARAQRFFSEIAARLSAGSASSLDFWACKWERRLVGLFETAFFPLLLDPSMALKATAVSVRLEVEACACGGGECSTSSWV